MTAVLLGFTLFFPIYGQSPIDGGAFANADDAFEFVCLPNGDVLTPKVLRYSLYGDQPAIRMNWDADQFLSPTISFGHLSFATAKTIDLLWDLVVGRTGQLLLAVYTYPVVKKTMMRHWESNAVPIPVYTSLVFDRISAFFLITLLRRVCTKRSTKYRRHNIEVRRPSHIGAWMASSFLYIGIYIVAFPTIMAIATSY